MPDRLRRQRRTRPRTRDARDHRPARGRRAHPAHPLRLPAGAVGAHPGATALGAGARRRARARSLMYEPRGHRDMYGAVLLPPYRDDADIAVLFMHNEGYSTMCGHGVIALTTGLIEEGLYPATDAGHHHPLGDARRAGHRRGGRRARRGRRAGGARRPVHQRALLPPRESDISRVHRGPRPGRRCSWRSAVPTTASWTPPTWGCASCPSQIDALTAAGAAITAALRRDHTPTHPTDAGPGLRLRHHHRRPRPGDLAGRTGRRPPRCAT